MKDAISSASSSRRLSARTTSCIIPSIIWPFDLNRDIPPVRHPVQHRVDAVTVSSRPLQKGVGRLEALA